MDKHLLEKQIEHLKPILAPAGKSITVVSVNEDDAVFQLSGFCGGCGCSQSYKDGLEQMVRDVCPTIQTIHFEEA